MTNHKQNATLITWGGISLLVGALLILFTGMTILTSTGYADTDMELVFFYMGVALGILGGGLILTGVHNVVSSLGAPSAEPVEEVVS